MVEANLGIGYINCGKPENALEIFSKLLINDKLLEDFYLKNIGVVHYNLKNIDSAEYYFSRLKNDYPQNTEVDAYLQLVADYKKQNIAPLTTANNVIINTNQTAQFDEAFIMYQAGKKQEAEKMLLAFTNSNPNHAMSFAVLGLIADEKKQYAKSISYYKKSIAINPTDYRIQYNLGNTYLKNNNEAEAVKQFEKTIAIEPNYINAYKSLELYYKSKNNLDKESYYSKKIRELQTK